jgi:hypothetical protein
MSDRSKWSGQELIAPDYGSSHAQSARRGGVELRQLISTDVIRWDEKAGLRTGCGVRSQVIDALEGARDKGDRQ